MPSELEATAKSLVRERYFWSVIKVAVVVLVLGAVAAFGLTEIHRAELRSDCNVLEHRIASRTSERTIILTLQAIARGAVDRGEQQFKRAIESIKPPSEPSQELIEERDRVCRLVGIPIETPPKPTDH